MLERLIDSWIRDEALYREAQRLGLAEGDEIVRRRLVDKMEFLLRDARRRPSRQRHSSKPTERPMPSAIRCQGSTPWRPPCVRIGSAIVATQRSPRRCSGASPATELSVECVGHRSSLRSRRGRGAGSRSFVIDVGARDPSGVSRDRRSARRRGGGAVAAARGGRDRLALRPGLSSGWLDRDPDRRWLTADSITRAWRIPSPREAIAGQQLRIEGLEGTLTDVLARIRSASGAESTEMLNLRLRR